MKLKVYLSGEIHTNWRDEIIDKCKSKNLEIEFSSPTTNHELSDDVGVKILGDEEKKFWHDNKGAKINAIRTRNSIEKADIVVVRFGEKYKEFLKQILNLLMSQFSGTILDFMDQKKKLMISSMRRLELIVFTKCFHLI